MGGSSIADFRFGSIVEKERLEFSFDGFAKKKRNLEDPMIKRLLHVRYRVSDLEKTVSFYKEVLGLKEIERLRSPRGSEIVFLKAPEGEKETRNLQVRP